MDSKPLFLQNGQSLMEVIIAATVGILVVTALTFATIFSLRNANVAKNQAQATKLAQEGIEKIRTARDRNAAINSIPGNPPVSSWNGGGSGGALWAYPIYSGCGSGGDCYLKFNSSSSYDITYLTTSASFPIVAEAIAPIFQRAIILSDDASTYTVQKTVTIIVRWSDFSGAHESRLSTILRKL